MILPKNRHDGNPKLHSIHMQGMWTLGGLSIMSLLKRTARESWQDDVSPQRPIHLVPAPLGHASVSTTDYLHARPSQSSSFYPPD